VRLRRRDRVSGTHDLRFALLFGAGIAAILAALYGLGVYAAGDVVPRGTSVAGVEVGGLTPAVATATLRHELAPRLDDPVVVSVNGHEFRVTPQEVGLHVDIPATVQAAYGGSRINPVRMLHMLIGGDPVSPVVDVDRDAMRATLRRLAARADTEPSEPTVTFEGGAPHVHLGTPGAALDPEAASNTIADGYLESTGAIELPTTEVPSAVGAPLVRAALASFGRPAVSGPVTLRVAGKTISLSPAEYGPALSMHVRHAALHPQFDVDRLWSRLHTPIAATLPRARNASVVIRRGVPRILPSQPGRTVNPTRLATVLLAALPRSGPHRTASVGTILQPPSFTRADARRLKITRAISGYALPWPGRPDREAVRATAKVDGTLLDPADVFSFNQAVGDRHTGLSVLATALFNAAYTAGLQDTSHRHHPVAVSGYPPGRDVVVGWPVPDFTFTNNTPFGLLIHAWLSPPSARQPAIVHVRLFSSPHFRTGISSSGIYGIRPHQTRYDPSPSCRPRAGLDGYDIDIFRSVFTSHRLVDQEQIHAAYLAQDRVVCHQPPGTRN
jgi:vancomycin resistance protein YoaR